MPHNQPVTSSSPVKRNFLNEIKIVQGKLKTAPLSYLQDQEKICQQLLAKFSQNEEHIDNPEENHQQLTLVYVEILYRQIAYSTNTVENEKKCREIQAAFVAHLEKYPVKDSQQAMPLKECLREMIDDKKFAEGKIPVIINVLEQIYGDNNERLAECFSFFTHYCFKNNLPYIDLYVAANEARKKLSQGNPVKKWVGKMLRTIGNDPKSEKFKKDEVSESKKEIPLYDDFVKKITEFLDLATNSLDKGNLEKAKEHSEAALQYVLSHDQYYSLEQIFESLIKSASLNTKICLRLDPKNTSFAIQSYENISYNLLVHHEENEIRKEKCQTTWLLAYLKHIVLPHFADNASLLEKFKTILTAHQKHVKFSDSFTFDDQKKLEEIMVQLKTHLPEPKAEEKKKKKKKKPKFHKQPVITPPKKKKTVVNTVAEAKAVAVVETSEAKKEIPASEIISSDPVITIPSPKAEIQASEKPKILQPEPTVPLTPKKIKPIPASLVNQPPRPKVLEKNILPLAKPPVLKRLQVAKVKPNGDTNFKLDSADFPPLPAPTKKIDIKVPLVKKDPQKLSQASTASINQSLAQKELKRTENALANPTSVQNASLKPTIIVVPAPINLGNINSQINSLQQSVVELKKDNAELIKQHEQQAGVIAELKAQLQQVSSQQYDDPSQDIQETPEDISFPTETNQEQFYSNAQYPTGLDNGAYPQQIYPVMLVPVTYYQNNNPTMFQPAPFNQEYQHPTFQPMHRSHS